MNPYKVLGVSENASQEEIRKAYLTLVKKYHPDRYTDEAMKELANEKLKEVNQAYEMLVKKKDDPRSQSYQTSGNYWQNRGSYTGEYRNEFAQVRSYLSQSNLSAAEALLRNIPLHNGEWNYLSGVLYFRRGWYNRPGSIFPRPAASARITRNTATAMSPCSGTAPPILPAG